MNVAAPDCVGITGSGGAGSTRHGPRAVPTLPGRVDRRDLEAVHAVDEVVRMPARLAADRRALPVREDVGALEPRLRVRRRELENRVGLADHARRAGGDRHRRRDRVDDERARRGRLVDRVARCALGRGRCAARRSRAPGSSTATCTAPTCRSASSMHSKVAAGSFELNVKRAWRRAHVGRVRNRSWSPGRDLERAGVAGRALRPRDAALVGARAVARAVDRRAAAWRARARRCRRRGRRGRRSCGSVCWRSPLPLARSRCRPRGSRPRW